PTIGLLLMRPQIVSGARGHYDRLIRSIEKEGLSVLPVLSTFMDNRQAAAQFFAESGVGQASSLSGSRPTSPVAPKNSGPDSEETPDAIPGARISQLLSLTGFSFVGGPAMNDSQAAVEFLTGLNVPLRSMVSLDIQTIESWQSSRLGLN